MIAYKVFRRKNGKLRSFSECIPKAAKMTYGFGYRVTPKIKKSKIFVFRTFEEALNFSGFTGLFEAPSLPPEIEIWQVSIPKSSGYLRRRLLTDDSLEIFRKFWESEGEVKDDDDYFVKTPTGTMGADWVRLIKRAKLKKIN